MKESLCIVRTMMVVLLAATPQTAHAQSPAASCHAAILRVCPHVVLGFECDSCVGRNQFALHDAGCTKQDYLNYCESGVSPQPGDPPRPEPTCSDQLQMHCSNVQFDCDKCTFCAYQQSQCGIHEQREFCKLICGGDDGTEIDIGGVGGGYKTFNQADITRCMIKAEELCGRDNDDDDPRNACPACIERNTDALKAAGCNDDNQDGSLDANDLMLEFFCSAASCIPSL